MAKLDSTIIYGSLQVTSDANVTGIITVDTGASTDIKFGQCSDEIAYNILSLNGVLTRSGHIGLEGGGSGNANLYLDVASGGVFHFRNHNAAYGTWDVDTLSVTGNITPTGSIVRTVSVAGYQVGSYNTADNSSKSNPIYTIGTAYEPADTTLGNMYGIGYTNSSSTFINSTDLGTTPSGWGMYVAADGNARIFFQAQSGNIHALGTVYAADFGGNSDIRKKENIELLPNKKINSIYKSFNLIGNEQERVGVIAQELEIENPEFVRTDSEGYKSVSYIDLHSAEIAYLKDKVEKLEEIINKLIK